MGPLPLALSGRAPRRDERQAGSIGTDRSHDGDSSLDPATVAASDPVPTATSYAEGRDRPTEVAPAGGPAVVARSVVAGQVATSGVPHGVSWLPVSPVVTGRPSQLYLWTEREPDRIDEWGLPSPDLFLLACQDPLRVADRKRAGFLLRVAVPAQAAIDLLDHLQQVPDNVKRRIDESGSTHLVPMAWLTGVKVTARFELDGRAASRPAARSTIVPWRSPSRAPTTEYQACPMRSCSGPIAGCAATRRHTSCSPRIPRWSPCIGRRITASCRCPGAGPGSTDGEHLLEVRIRRRGAIDVPATLDKLRGLPVVGRLHDFVGEGPAPVRAGVPARGRHQGLADRRAPPITRQDHGRDSGRRIGDRRVRPIGRPAFVGSDLAGAVGQGLAEARSRRTRVASWSVAYTGVPGCWRQL